MPTTSLRYMFANARFTYPPKECPTRTYGPGKPMASSSVCNSCAICCAVRGAVIAYRTSELRHVRLHQRPTQAGRAHTRFENHSRCAFSGYVDVHPPRVDSYEASGGRKAPAVPPRPDCLVDGTRDHRQGERDEESRENNRCCSHGVP